VKLKIINPCFDILHFDLWSNANFALSYFKEILWLSYNIKFRFWIIRSVVQLLRKCGLRLSYSSQLYATYLLFRSRMKSGLSPRRSKVNWVIGLESCNLQRKIKIIERIKLQLIWKALRNYEENFTDFKKYGMGLNYDFVKKLWLQFAKKI
jgi:hypothetical protein